MMAFSAIESQMRFFLLLSSILAFLALQPFFLFFEN
jgi:hypothetical protein